LVIFQILARLWPGYAVLRFDHEIAVGVEGHHGDEVSDSIMPARYRTFMKQDPPVVSEQSQLEFFRWIFRCRSSLGLPVSIHSASRTAFECVRASQADKSTIPPKGSFVQGRSLGGIIDAPLEKWLCGWSLRQLEQYSQRSSSSLSRSSFRGRDIALPKNASRQGGGLARYRGQARVLWLRAERRSP
jgi:hypothetical protein